MITPDTTTGIRLDGTPQNAARLEFLALLFEHDEITSQLALSSTMNVSRAELLETYRRSHRAVVAAYDHATLTPKSA